MELMHFIAFHCISVSGWILFYRGESGKSQVCSRLQPIFSSRVLRLYISHFSVYKMEVCWLDCSQYPTYLYIMGLLFGSSFILLDSFQLDLAVYPGISLISPGLRLPAQEKVEVQPHHTWKHPIYKIAPQQRALYKVEVQPHHTWKHPIYKIAPQHCTANIVL